MSEDRVSHGVEPGGDDRSLRDQGRHLAMDSLLEMALVDMAGPSARRRARGGRPTWAVPAALAALAATVLLALAGVVAIRSGPRPVEPGPVLLAGGWRISPTGTATYRVLGPDAIRLERGELFVEPTAADAAAGSLTIETPAGRVTGQATRLYVGCHADDARTRVDRRAAGGADRDDRDDRDPGTGKERPMKTRLLTRVLVLAGVATLANVHGEVTGRADDLLVAEDGDGAAPERHAVKANGDFAFDLYGQLAKENAGKNLFFSPYSMASALAMTVEGARGETAAEMGAVLRYPDAARRIGGDAQLLPWNTGLIHTGMAALTERFQSRADTPYEISVANALYGSQRHPFSPDFVATIDKFYGTGAVVPVNFADPKTTEQINAWAEERTRGRIKDLVPKGALNVDTILVLLNAIYFKGNWAVPFDARFTEQADFRAAGGRTIAVQMMRNRNLQGGRYGAFKADGTPFKTPANEGGDVPPETLYPGKGGFQVAELPYKGNDLSMVLVVPQDADGLAAVEEQLTTENLQAWLATLESRDIHMAMPKFRIEGDYKMKDSLVALGMRQAFDIGAANFSGLSGIATGIWIHDVFHKSFVEVTEKGTEAAAATAVVIETQSRSEPFTPAVRADRPFVFAIRDVRTGTILFLGRLTDPTGTEVPAAAPTP